MLVWILPSFISSIKFEPQQHLFFPTPVFDEKKIQIESEKNAKEITNSI